MTRRRQEGFTLIEIMAALALLGFAMYILLDSHITTLWLYDSSRQSVEVQSLIEEAVTRAEVEVLAGNLSGGEEFGKRYPEFAYTYEAQLAQDETIPLYQVAVTINGPEVQQTVTYFLYDTRQ